MLPGNFQAFRIGMFSLVEQLIKETNADVFVIGGSFYNMHAFVKDVGPHSYLRYEVTPEDEELIRRTLGRRLVYFGYTEHLPGYDEKIRALELDYQNRIRWFNPTKESVAWYDPVAKQLKPSARRYLDQWFLLEVLSAVVAEKRWGSYDVWVRGRLDTFWNTKIPWMDGDLCWYGMDNFFYGRPEVMAKVSHFVNFIGSYDTSSDGAATFCGQDYRLGPEPQFRAFVRNLGIRVSILPLKMGVSLFRPDGRGGCLVAKTRDWVNSERLRWSNGLSIWEYYHWEKLDLPWLIADPKVKAVVGYTLDKAE
jgi:hypothetical protein